MIARKSALSVAILASNGILGYIALKFISLHMEPWEYGVIGFSFGFVSLFTIFGSFGFDLAHVKRISEGKNLGVCNGTYLTTKIILIGLFTTVVVGAVGIWRHFFGGEFESVYHEQAVFIMLAYFVLLAFSQSLVSTFNARKETAKAQIPLLFYHIIRTAATIYVARMHYGPIALAYTYVLGEIFHFIFAFYFFRKYPVSKPSLAYFKQYSKFALQMAVVVGTTMVIMNIDKVFIQIFWTAQEVGEYFAVYNLSRFIAILAGAIGILILPTVSAYHSKKNMKEIQTLIVSAERYLSMFAFPVIIFLVVLAKPIIPLLLSNRYENSLWIMYVLPFYVLLSVLSNPYQHQMQGMDMPHFTRNRVLIMLGVNIVFNLLLIPSELPGLNIPLAGLGGLGAAITAVITYGTGLVYIRIIVWKKTKIAGSSRIILHIFAATIMGLILYFLSEMILIERWFHLVIFGILALEIYFGILWMIKEFTIKDFDFILDTLNIRKMFFYVKDEIFSKK